MVITIYRLVPGHHHVNCREESYWVDVFKNYGLRYSEQLTNEFKGLSQMRKNFFKRAGMVFLNEDLLLFVHLKNKALMKTYYFLLKKVEQH